MLPAFDIKKWLIKFAHESDSVIADQQDFPRLVTLPQLFVFVSMILVESFAHQDPLSLIVKLAGIIYLLLSTAVQQLVFRSFTVRFVCYHLTCLLSVLLLLTLIAGQDFTFNFYLPAGLLVLSIYPLHLSIRHLLIVIAPLTALVAVSSTAYLLLASRDHSATSVGISVVLACIAAQLTASIFRVEPDKRLRNLYNGKNARTAARQPARNTGNVEEDTEFWYQVYYALLFQETLSEVIWRLPILYLLSHAVVMYSFTLLAEKNAILIAVPITLALFQIFLHARLIKHKDYHELLQRVLLLSVGCLLSSAVIMASLGSLQSIAAVFLLFQVLWMALVPWTTKFSLFLAAISLSSIVAGAWYWSGFYLFGAAAVFVIVIGVKLSSITYLALIIRTALSFLGRYCGIAPAPMTILKMVARLFSTITGVSQVLILYSKGRAEEVGRRHEKESLVDPLLARAFFFKIDRFDQAEGIYSCRLLEDRFKSALLDWYGKVPRRLFFFRVELIVDEKEEKALIVLPVSVVARVLGIRRTFTALATMLGVARISFASARTRFLSSDVLQSYQRSVNTLEGELNEIVHLVNNAAQDIAIYCDQARGRLRTDETQEFDPRLNHLLRNVEICSRSLSAGVSDLKLRKEINSIRRSDHSESVLVREVMEELNAFGEYHSGRKGFKFEMENYLPETAAVKVISREYLETALRTLIRCAVARCRDAGAVRVTAVEDSGKITFTVSDNGELIKEGEVLLHEALEESSVQNFAVMSAGELEFSTPDKRFNNALSLRLQSGEIIAFNAVMPGQWVLLVDDNDQVTTFYARVAEALQLKYFTASSLSQASLILEQQGRPRLVITDLQLSDSSGLDLIRLIRNKFGIELPIIVVSGNREEDLDARLRAHGATKYLMKPVGRRRLFSEIKSIL
ncbi:MAG: response regulator [Deltaproteobacteria bacterium]|nr:response regulator [Deltaproteobacteria bacterium]